MAETDVFERRLRTALDRHVADGPTDFDALGFARTVAAREPRRKRLRVALDWRRAVLPRTAWALLLVALLSVLGAGVLFVGSHLSRETPAMVPPVTPAFACPPGSTPDVPGPADQARPPRSARLAMAFDRRAGKLVAVTTGGNPVETWTFDVCTNTWTRMWPSNPPRRFDSALVYDTDSDLTIGIASNNVWVYDLAANAWTEKGVAPTDEPAFYDPVSGLVVAGGASEVLWDYDVEADGWTPIRESILPENLGSSQYAYDASVDRMIWRTAGGDALPQTWLFDLRHRAWSRSDAQAPAFRMGMWAEPTMVYDEAAMLTLVASTYQWGAFDATADSWEVLFDAESNRGLGAPAMVYDPTNRRLIVQGGGIAAIGDLVAFDLVDRSWTVLLEPRD